MIIIKHFRKGKTMDTILKRTWREAKELYMKGITARV